ncbi:MAG: hypothetical protein KDD11_22925 [Acidobacteria bacterium]|nr:hypothetical protein [Acidobacteriota bacterium]
MSEERQSPPPWKGVLGLAGGMFLGAVLLVAAWGKILDPAAFARQITLEGLDFLLPAGAVAVLALALEVGLGSALLLGLRRLWVLVPTALLVLFFVGLTGRAYWLTAHGLRDPAESCGCFGNLVQRSPAEAFWQDLLLLVPPLLLAFVAPSWGSRRGVRARSLVAAVLTIAGLVFAWKAPELPLDDLATRLKPGVAVSDLCIGDGAERVCLDMVVPELDQGSHVVVLADLDAEGFTSSVDALNDYVFAGEGPTLWVLSSADQARLRRFFFERAPSFEIREAPGPLMQPLYRRLPRSFEVVDGRVVRTYPGLPPLDRLATSETGDATPAHQEAS